MKFLSLYFKDTMTEDFYRMKYRLFQRADSPYSLQKRFQKTGGKDLTLWSCYILDTKKEKYVAREEKLLISQSISLMRIDTKILNKT